MKKIIDDINSMLSDMNETQIENVYNYNCDEYDEEGHEGNLAELLVNITKENTLRSIVLESLIRYVEPDNIKDKILLDHLKELGYMD